MRLAEPSIELEEAYWDFARDLESAGDGRYSAEARELGYQGFVEKRRREAVGAGLAEGLVPMSVYWLMEGRVILGELRLRHCLTPRLEREGGHIGYVVRPSMRGRGLGKQILRLGLEAASAMRLERVLITCDDDNLASSGVIEANGGAGYESAVSEESGKLIRRYWLVT